MTRLTMATLALTLLVSLAANAEKTTPMIKIVEEKEGKIKDEKDKVSPPAQKGDTVSVHYVGKLKEKDGKTFKYKVFDRSIKEFTFTLGAGMVIKGFEQGVLGMRKGGKRTIDIPPELGYGEKGGGDIIPPNSWLTFEIELVRILKD